MLARVADRIFWMSRQVERAESLARILGVTSNMVLFGSAALQRQNLVAPLSITGTEEAFHEMHRELELPELIEFLALDPANPNSIYSCLRLARENAHEVRWQITSEMWETLNGTWLELRRMRASRVTGAGATEFLDWVKERSLLFNGAYANTMLRNDAYFFTRLGTFIERADNTARILDVKYHLLLPADEPVGGSLDYFQWSAILRTVSANTAYHWVYRDSLKPWLVADLLILNEQMPRSLASCYENLVRHADAIAHAYGRQGPAQRKARAVHTRLQNSKMDEIFQSGLHEFIGGFISDNNQLGAALSEQYLM